MKGIILAGGSGTRLYPMTFVTSKQLLPIYDKPMIYYPLSTLMLAGIKDILIISTPQDINNFEKLLGDGNRFGVNLSYRMQIKPEGLAQAFLIGQDFINGDSCAMILGDNIFHGNGLSYKLKKACESAEQGVSTIFGYYVKDPKSFGVIEFDSTGKIIGLEEKPENPKSNYIATGLYFYNKEIVDYAKKVKFSKRNELEITDLNNLYLKDMKLNVELLGRGYAWIDTGTVDSLIEAANFVKIIENRQGIQIAALEEIAFYNNWINGEELLKAADLYGKSDYGEYLKKIFKEEIKHKDEVK